MWRAIDNLPKILDAALSIILGLAEGLLAALPELIAALPAIIIAIVNSIISSIPQIIEAGVRLLGALVLNLPAIIGAILEAIAILVGTMLEAFGSFIGHFANIGKNMVLGIWEGIKSLGAWIKAQVTTFFKNILGGLAKFLGIHSPSQLMADMFGKNMALGIGEGFGKEMANVEKQMEDAIPTEFDVDYSGMGKGMANALGDSFDETLNVNANIPRHVSEAEADPVSPLLPAVADLCTAILAQIEEFAGVVFSMNSLTNALNNVSIEAPAAAAPVGAESNTEEIPPANYAVDYSGVDETDSANLLYSAVTELCQAIWAQIEEFAGVVFSVNSVAEALRGLNIAVPVEASAAGGAAMVNHFYFDNITVRDESDMEAIADFTLRKLQIAMSNRCVRL